MHDDQQAGARPRRGANSQAREAAARGEVERRRASSARAARATSSPRAALGGRRARDRSREVDATVSGRISWTRLPATAREGGAQRLVPRDDRAERARERRTSSGPRRRSARGMLYAPVSGSSCSRNHSRCCANDSGSGSRRAAGSRAAGSRPFGRQLPHCVQRPASSASPAMRSAASGLSERVNPLGPLGTLISAMPEGRLDTRGRPRPSALRTGAQRQLDGEGVADPRDHAGSPAASGRRGRRSRRATPTRGDAAAPRPRSPRAPPRRRRAARRSRSPRRGRPLAARAARLRSTLPFGVSGSAVERHERAGHHVVGQLRSRARSRSSAGLPRRAACAAHVGDEPLVAGRVLAHARRTASRTPGCARSAASISPSSMRKPRTFTWWSTRPRNSSVAVRRASAPRSPVR